MRKLYFIITLLAILLNVNAIANHTSTHRNFWQHCNLFDYSNMYSTQATKVARHEAGHALMALLCHNCSVYKATINSCHNYAGCVTFSTKNLEDKIKISLAGYAAEKLFYGQASLGITNDLDKATQTAMQLTNIHSRFGQSPKRIHTNMQKSLYANKRQTKPYKKSSRIFFGKTYFLLKTLLKQTEKIIKENKELLEEIAQGLLQNKTLYGYQIAQIVNKEK